MARRPVVRSIAAVLALALVLGACGGDDTGGSVDGGGGTAPLRPGATYPAPPSSAP